jgi:hypothetical protein
MITGILLLILALSGIMGRYLEKEEKMTEKEEPNVRKRKWLYLGGSIFFITILIAIVIGASIFDMTRPNFEFNTSVHSHMENAYFANNPELMNSELNMAIDGMKDLNLKENMYGSIWWWENVPHRRMDYQYRHLEGVVSRVDSVIDWRNKVYAENNNQMSETLGDVYEQKMDNLRGFLKEDGWSDWIAKDCYYANYYIILCVLPIIVCILLIPIVFLVIFALWGAMETDGSYIQRKNNDGKWEWSYR